MPYKHGDNICSEFLILKSSIEKTKTNKPYVDFSCRDLDGTIYEHCKKWDTNQPLKGVVHIEGGIELFNDALQIKVKEWHHSSRPSSDFVVKAPWLPDQQALFEIILETVHDLPEKFADYTLKCLEFWDTHEFPSCQQVHSRFYTHPGAQNIHHAYLHGLVEHTQEVVTNIVMLASANGLNQKETDLCIMGGVLHDIGKMDEYHLYEGVYDYSQVGKAYGWNSNAHLYIGSSMLTVFNMIAERDSSYPKLNEDDFLLLQNIILGHHGQFANPHTLHRATMLVHMADNTSAQLNRMRYNLVQSNTGIVEKDPVRDRYISIPDYSK